MTGASRPLDVWMMFMRPLSIMLSIVLGTLATLLGNAVAVAQTWPSRPITMVVPFRPARRSIWWPGRSAPGSQARSARPW